jgi:hypothetical protein
MDAGGNQNSHGLELEVHRRWSAGLEFMVDYFWSKTLTDVTDTTNAHPKGASYGGPIENPYDRTRDRGISPISVPQRLVVNHVWTLPFGKGSKWLNQSRLLDSVVGGWTLMGLWSWQSRTYVTPVWSGSDFSNTNTFSARPDVVAGCNPNVDSPSASKTYNASCFVQPPNGRFGTAGKSVVLTVPRGLWPNTTLAFFKYFTPVNIFKDQGLRFRVGAEMVNPANHPILAFGSTVVNSAGAGTGFYTGTRTVRFNLRLEF